MWQIKDIAGQRFGRLVAIEFAGLDNHGKAKWRCRCDCGSSCVVSRGNLLSGATQSCGCLQRERRGVKGKNAKHGGYGTRLYSAWHGIRARCNNPNNHGYSHYGGRGVKICKEWDDFALFRAWALENGYDETAPFGKCTLDRIDPNGDYCPENCRWVSAKEQANNRRNNRIVTYEGEKYTLSALCEKTGIPWSLMWDRLDRGMSVEEAVNKPRKELRKNAE
jgi:hypothetical protein